MPVIYFSRLAKLTAAQAKEVGVVNQVFPKQDFEQGFNQYCAQVVASAPMTLAAAKFAMRQVARPAGERDMAKVQALYEACFKSQDYAEGRAAFLEKRTPRFVGK